MPRKVAGKTEATQQAPQVQPWLATLALQLDAIVPEDPQKRSAGTLIVRALIREAVKGDVRAIKECIRLSKERPEASVPARWEATTDRGRGRPAREIDLEGIQRLARLGMKDVTNIGRCLGIPKQTLHGQKHAEEVREAFAVGRAFFEHDALHQYEDDIAHSRRNPLVIFKMKQLGWTDKVHSIQSDGSLSDVAGARERLRGLVEKWRSTKRSVGGNEVGPGAAEMDDETQPTETEAES